MHNLEVLDKELKICNNIINTIDFQLDNYINYKNKICLKPWGYEFLAFENNKIAIWILNININNKTSMHTHFKKDTILIVLSGIVKINLIDNNYKLLSINDIIYIPKYKFHSIESITDNCNILELEIFDDNIKFTNKNDLYRIIDDFKRDNVGYNNSIQISNDLKKYNYFYFDEFILNEKFKIISNLNNINLNNIYILLKGYIYIDGIYIKEGSILNKYLNNILNFNNLLILEINCIYSNEDKKIIYNLKHLKLIMNDIKDKSNILTSGCFDLLHIGHLELLKNAKKEGDNLIVCLSNDEQIKKLKGHNRPINNYNDRINLFKTIYYIDYIILYDEENIEKESTLDNIINIVKPKYWVKGDDYNITDIQKKHPTVNIKLFKNIDNISTTNIISNIINKYK